jgi:hypothetical protein
MPFDLRRLSPGREPYCKDFIARIFAGTVTIAKGQDLEHVPPRTTLHRSDKRFDRGFEN